MKIALVHDYLKEFGGAERVLETMHEIWPEAPVYTAFVDWKGLGPHAERLKDWDIRLSWVQKVWPVKKLHSPLRFLAPLVWESFSFDEYDVVITSSAWYIPRGIVTRPDTVHICYLHTPPRHLYGYETSSDWKRYLPVRVYGHIVNHFLRMYDYLAAQRVDWFIANSEETKRRIAKFYRREAKVIYPPVEAQSAKRKAQNNNLEVKAKEKITNYQLPITNYYLCVSRLARAKHIDLAIEACQRLGVPLVIVGKGQMQDYLRSTVDPEPEQARFGAGSRQSTVYFMGEVEDETLSGVYAGAKALIFPAQDEEFGIVPVEAMEHGIPVIAYRSGGVVETVVEGKTGVFFDELKAESLIKAIKQLNNQTIKPYACKKQAQKFSGERFKREIKKFVEKIT